MRRQLLTLPIAGLIAAAALAACADDSDSADGEIDVVAGFYPLAFAAEQVGGDRVNVTNLTPAGVEPHDLELAPSDIAEIEQADLVVYLEGFSPALDEAVEEYASDKALEVSEALDLLDYDDTEFLEEDHGDEHAEEDEHEHTDEATEDQHAHEGEHTEEATDEAEHTEDEAGHDHDHEAEGTDPHVWLDPRRYGAIGELIGGELTGIDTEGDQDFLDGVGDFKAELEALEQEYTEGLADRTSDDIVTSHAAFGYLADRFGLHQIAISGLSPDQEPSSQRMAEIAEYVEEHGVTTIFFETLVPSDIADTIAAETGAETATLNPLEGLTEDQDGEDYFSIMRDNLAVLQEALGAA